MCLSVSFLIIPKVPIITCLMLVLRCHICFHFIANTHYYYYYNHHYYYHYSFEGSFTWSSTRVWVTASLIKSPEIFSVFWLVLIILSFWWSPLVLLFPNPPVPLSIPCWLYQVKQLQLVSPSLSSSMIFNSLARSRYLSFFSLSFSFNLWSAAEGQSP